MELDLAHGGVMAAHGGLPELHLDLSAPEPAGSLADVGRLGSQKQGIVTHKSVVKGKGIRTAPRGSHRFQKRAHDLRPAFVLGQGKEYKKHAAFRRDNGLIDAEGQWRLSQTLLLH